MFVMFRVFARLMDERQVKGLREIEAVYRTYFQDVYRYALKLTQDPQLSEDLTSETFLKAMDALQKFRGQCALRVWLCQITKNLYFSHLRKSRRMIPVEQLPDSPEDPLEGFLDQDEARGIAATARQLKEPYRQVFSLRLSGLPFQEIGALFDKSANWACVVYHRARKMIREEWEEQNAL